MDTVIDRNADLNDPGALQRFGGFIVKINCEKGENSYIGW